MGGTGGGGQGGGADDIKDTVIVSMVDSVKLANWKSNAQYLRVKTEIGLRKSNGTINDQEKELLISTLDINYAISLNKKYDAIKKSFTSFPSTLYSEMLAFQSKYPNLSVGIKELNAFLQLQQMEGIVNQFLNERFNLSKSNNLRNQINEIPIGSLAGNSMCTAYKSSYYQKIGSFQSDVQTVTDLIETAEKYPDEYSKYKDLGDWQFEQSVLKYSYYKTWFSNPNNQRYL